MAATENTLILETTQGPVTIEMRPDLAPGHVARSASPLSPMRAFTTAWSSTA